MLFATATISLLAQSTETPAWVQGGVAGAVSAIAILLLLKVMPKLAADTVVATALREAEYEARSKVHRDREHKLRDEWQSERMANAAVLLRLTAAIEKLGGTT